TLREDRRKTYSPVLPVSPTSGRVLQVPVAVIDAEAGLIAFDDEDGGRVQQSAFGGLAKLQWKVDWAARWVALGVDYEMSGKDLIDSVTQSGRIAQMLGHPGDHIHGSKVAETKLPVTYGLLLNLVSVAGVADKDTAWESVQRYAPGASPETDPELDELIGLAVNYARDFVVPTLKRRPPSDVEAAALRDLDSELAKLPPDADGEIIQHAVFEVGKRHPFESLRGWFQALY